MQRNYSITPTLQIPVSIPQICRAGGSVLNVGFGLGLVDEEIQKHSPGHHTIVEAHPGECASLG